MYFSSSGPLPAGTLGCTSSTMGATAICDTSARSRCGL
jgi:hypothetical protein